MDTKYNYYDFEIDFDKMLNERSTLDEVLYAKDLKLRKLFLEDCITQETVSEIIKHIMQYNADDKGLDPEKRKPILLYISSSGGEVDAGFSLIDVISLSKTPVYTINTGCWYSMAFLIGIAGDKRFSFPNSRFLVHDGSSYTYGSSAKVQDEMEFNKRVGSRIKEFIINNSSLTEQEYESKYRVEWYMFAQEAMEKGFIDGIVGENCDLYDII